MSEHTFVQWVIRVGLEEEILQADHDRVEVEDGLPVLAENVETDVAFEVDVWVVDLCQQIIGATWSAWCFTEERTRPRSNTNLLRAFDLGRVVWVVVVDRECELERSRLVHACRYEHRASGWLAGEE